MGLEREFNNLEKRVNEGGNWRQTAFDLAMAVPGAIIAYNAAGSIFTNFEFSNLQEFWGTAGILTAGTIAGYKARSFFKRIWRTTKRTTARTKTIREISEDDEFIKRQGIEEGTSGKIRKAAKYALTVPLGGLLGYIPGSIGIVPLCIYFGAHYNSHQWVENSLASGTIAGSIIGAYAYGEMAQKNQWRRMITTSAALLGAIGAQVMTGWQDFPTAPEMWNSIGIDLSAALVCGVIAKESYDAMRNRNQPPNNK